MTVAQLVVRYASFAVLSILANLATQRAVLLIMQPAEGFILAVGAGTVVGLLIKYQLDKRWIFHDMSTGLSAHGRKFTLYATMGIFTTLIFWGTETAFWVFWKTDLMREVGAVLGLTIGYVIKYLLDRRYVFQPIRGTAT
ncbi:MAG: putative flippase GtrA [Paracoccaceae bacterium]|jgi:putative flippase GtrA